MSSSESFDLRYPALGLGMYSLGNGIVINYPKTQFTWSFYNSPTTTFGGAEPKLASYLTDSKIGFNSRAYANAPGSNFTRPGNIQISRHNHAAAVAAEVGRIKNQFGSSIRGEVLSNGEAALRMQNLNGNVRTLDAGVRTRSFLTGSVDRFFEVKTGLTDLKGTRGARRELRRRPMPPISKSATRKMPVFELLDRRCALAVARLPSAALATTVM